MTDLRARLEAADLGHVTQRYFSRSKHGHDFKHDVLAADAKAIAKVYVAARLAELADKEGGLMFDDFKGDGYETMGMWVGAKALLNLLFPETP